MKKKFMLSAALTLSMSLGLGAGIAQAATLTFAYEGVVDQSIGGAAFDAFLGEVLRIEYTFDDTTMGNVDTDPSSSQGIYSLSSYTATVGGNSYNGSGASITVSDGLATGLGLTDRYLVILDSIGAIGPAIGGIPFNGAQVMFNDSTLTAITGDGLPLIQPAPSAFDEPRLFIDFEGGAGEGQLTANIVTVSAVSAVPVPAAVWLFGSGLLGLLGLARRKRAV